MLSAVSRARGGSASRGALSPALATSGGCGLEPRASLSSGALAAALTAQGVEVKRDPSVVFALCLPGG